ncbi:hypothetical protein AN478_00045 [Thiohalorhabdus denitrificans]|uniref:Lipoprotein n=1 Tax=Thiohalorhabdus denitrificans TaxID=381306 RepID=A0A0P9ET55_9GAMM|nr:hypothetical protein [Thiohalorhabdus denitrificans]KPV41928.1 hypothetical protein AN478_00045 [Thiohalorhabdus denitrificans]SCY66457.1 hypothetical protein SAMN05661077_0077 [Thiohalorhabdus denitrificans]
MKIRFFALLAAASVLSGCATTYNPDAYDKNLTVNLNFEDRSLFASEDALLGVNDIAEGCTNDYKGDVTLSEGANEVGLAPNQETYLKVVLSQEHMFLRDWSTSRGTLLTPAPGQKYELDVAYADDMFDMRLYRVTPSGREEMELTPEPDCLAQS